MDVIALQSLDQGCPGDNNRRFRPWAAGSSGWYCVPPVKTALPIRILIAEDHLIARKGLNAIISAQPDMKVIGEAANGQQAVAEFRNRQPDVTIIDMRMPVMNGFDAISTIRAEFPAANIIAISAFGGDQDIRRALDLGANSYLSKDVLHHELIEAIQSVHKGERYLTAPVAASLATKLPAPNLSARELDVLNLIAQGESNKQIGYLLGIVEHTVKNHVKSILGKTPGGGPDPRGHCRD